MEGWFENSGATQRYTIYGPAPLTILPNLGTATAAELKTHDATMLALIEARLEGRLASGADLESYGVAGRSVAKIPFEQLMRARGIYAARVAKERNRGRTPFLQHRGAFTNAS